MEAVRQRGRSREIPSSFCLVLCCVVMTGLLCSGEKLVLPDAAEYDLSDSFFGLSVALGPSNVFVGAPYGNPWAVYTMPDAATMGGVVVIYPLDGVDPQHVLQSPSTPDRDTIDYYGVSVVANGDSLFVGCPACPSGTVYVYDKSDDYTSVASEFISDHSQSGFGAVVAAAGDWVAISDFSEDIPVVWIFKLAPDNTYMQVDSVEGNSFDGFGMSLCLTVDSADNVWLFVGAPHESINGTENAGAVHVFHTIAEQPSSFTETQVLALDNDEVLENDYLGTSIVVSPFNTMVSVGVPQIYGGGEDEEKNSGKVLMWIRDDETSMTWERQSQLTGRGSDNSNFGYALAVSSDSNTIHLVVGSPSAFHSQSLDGQSPKSGSIQFYDVEEGSSSWLTKQTLSGDYSPDGYGIALALTSNQAIVGAPWSLVTTGGATKLDPKNLPLSTQAIAGIAVGVVIGVGLVATLLSAIYFRMSGVHKVQGYVFFKKQ